MNETKKAVQRGSRASVGTGTISLLMIFTVLCFATLALLSLSTAASNRRIQERSLENAMYMAQAEGVAAQTIAQIDAAIDAVEVETDEEEESLMGIMPDPEEAEAAYYQAAQQAVRALGVEIDSVQHTITFVTEIDEFHELVTVLTIQPPDSSTNIVLTSQTSHYTGTWVPEGQGDLWTGN